MARKYIYDVDEFCFMKEVIEMVGRRLISVLAAVIFSLSLVTYGVAGGNEEKNLNKVEMQKIENKDEGKKADLHDEDIMAKMPEELLLEDLEDLDLE